MKEFNWLGECVSCNIECCHNKDKSVPENECAKPIPEELRIIYNVPRNNNYSIFPSDDNPHISKSLIYDLPDNRPLECRLFPFDVKEVDNKLMWIRKNNCYSSIQLPYEKHIDFFERKFSQEIPLSYIKKYVAHNKLKEIQEPLTDDQEPLTEEHIIIREINWQSGIDYII